MRNASVRHWIRGATEKMYKLLARKLLGDRYSVAVRSILISVIIGMGLHNLGTVIPLAQSVLILTAIFYSGTIIIQTLSSQDNARCLKGLFAMPHHDKQTLREYAAAVGAYTLFTKTSLLAALLYAFVQLTPLYIVLFFLGFLYALFGGFSAFALFRRLPAVSVLLAAAGIAIAFFAPAGLPAILLLAAADAAVMVLFSTLHLDSFYVQEKAALKGTGQNSVHGMLILRYVVRYLLANKNYLISTLVIVGFGCFFAMMSEQQGLEMGCGIGLAIASLNTPLAVIVSSNRGLNKKLNALPDKTGRFFVPYGIVLFILHLLINALYLGVYAIAASLLQTGGTVSVRALLTAVLFAAESAAGAALLENRFTITTWKTEPDLWHHPRKYILPVILVLEAALIFMI